MNEPTKTLRIEPAAFVDKKRKTIGDVFEEINLWGMACWRQDPEMREAWARLERLAWRTVGPVVVQTSDLKKLHAVLSSLNIGGPDARKIVRMFNVIADAAQPEQSETIDDLDLSDSDPPDSTSHTNGAAHA
jgi:hypothetical protein